MLWTCPRTCKRYGKGQVSDTNNNDNNNIYILHFEKTWSEYPNKKGKAKALNYYLGWIKGRKINKLTRKLTEEQMWYAVQRYKKECEGKEQQFIKHGDTFFNTDILDYVEVKSEQV